MNDEKRFIQKEETEALLVEAVALLRRFGYVSVVQAYLKRYDRTQVDRRETERK